MWLVLDSVVRCKNARRPCVRARRKTLVSQVPPVSLEKCLGLVASFPFLMGMGTNCHSSFSPCTLKTAGFQKDSSVRPYSHILSCGVLQPAKQVCCLRYKPSKPKSPWALIIHSFAEHKEFGPFYGNCGTNLVFCTNPQKRVWFRFQLRHRTGRSQDTC